MKEWKESLIDVCVAAADDQKIVSLKEIAAASGIKHISTQDTQDIMRAVSARLPEYRPVQLVAGPSSKESLFQSLCWIQNDVEFVDAGEEDA